MPADSARWSLIVADKRTLTLNNSIPQQIVTYQLIMFYLPLNNFFMTEYKFLWVGIV